jgi:hypothetical protein
MEKISRQRDVFGHPYWTPSREIQATKKTYSDIDSVWNALSLRANLQLLRLHVESIRVLSFFDFKRLSTSSRVSIFLWDFFELRV